MSRYHVNRLLNGYSVSSAVGTVFNDLGVTKWPGGTGWICVDGDPVDSLINFVFTPDGVGAAFSMPHEWVPPAPGSTPALNSQNMTFGPESIIIGRGMFKFHLPPGELRPVIETPNGGDANGISIWLISEG